MANILTPKERLIAQGLEEGTEADIKRITTKLNKYQRTITSESHIKKINALIPFAELGATRENRQGNIMFDSRIFIQNMNRLTKEAGLRC